MKKERNILCTVCERSEGCEAAIDYDALQDALEQIKMVCERAQANGGCANCPLGNTNGDCVLNRLCPKAWHPRHPETDVFRVLE